MKRVYIVFLLVLIIGQAFAQKTSSSPISKGLLGSLMVDFGFNFLRDEPATVELGVWGSRIFNAFYLYNIRLGSSRFMLSPGIGLGFENYKFNNNFTLTRSGHDRSVALAPASSILPQSNEIKKSKLSTSYVDIGTEIRFSMNRENPQKGFFMALGGKIGILISAHTKVSYMEDGQRKKVKTKETFELNPIRYGVYGRVGKGKFSLFYYQAFSELFQKDKGPDSTNTTPFNLGLSFALF